MKRLVLILLLVTGCKAEDGSDLLAALPDGEPVAELPNDPGDPESGDPALTPDDPEETPTDPGDGSGGADPDDPEEPAAIDYATHPLTGTWVNRGDPDLRFTFGADQAGTENSCRWSFRWEHLSFGMGPTENGQIRLTQLATTQTKNADTGYCFPFSGPWKQVKQCGWAFLDADGEELQLNCLYGTPGAASNVWDRE